MTDRFRIHPDVSRSSTLPGSFYSSRAVYDELTEKVLARAWHFVGLERGRASHAAPFELLPGSLDEPLALVHDEAGRARVLSNVCTHRGNLILGEQGGCKGLRCGYHGRRFDLDGHCTSSPEFEGALDFPAASDDLPRLPLERLGPWLFTSLAPALEFEAWAGPLRERLSNLWSADYVAAPEADEVYHVDAHWALYVDNYLEGFHIPYVHPGLNKLVDASTYETELQPWSNVQLADARAGDPTLLVSASGGSQERQLAGCYAWLFPNLMLNFYPWGLSVNVVEPLDPGSTRVRFLRFVTRPELLGQGAGGDLEGVQREDEAVVEAVQRGVRSRLYRAGRFAPRREVGVHHFHRLLAEALREDQGCASS